MATKRQIKDFKALAADGPKTGIYLKDVSRDLNKDPYTELRMMIVGPDGPYKNCLFFFRIYFTEKYPFQPPKVKFLCPYSIRCHPNLYQYYPNQSDDNIGNGKCCLSILGTWAGPPWTPMMTFETIAQTILMILDDEPLRNEPGYAKSSSEKIKPYADYVRWICLKESLPLWTQPLPEMYSMFQEEVSALFDDKREELIDQIIKLSEKFDGIKITSCNFYGNKTDQGKEYNYTGLLDQLL
jgi:ubiquitin-protein ligase